MNEILEQYIEETEEIKHSIKDYEDSIESYEDDIRDLNNKIEECEEEIEVAKEQLNFRLDIKNLIEIYDEDTLIDILNEYERESLIKSSLKIWFNEIYFEIFDTMQFCKLKLKEYLQRQNFTKIIFNDFLIFNGKGK